MNNVSRERKTALKHKYERLWALLKLKKKENSLKRKKEIYTRIRIRALFLLLFKIERIPPRSNAKLLV